MEQQRTEKREMNRTDIRLIALDLDGTLLNSMKLLSPANAAALERAARADRGILFYENERATTLRMALESGSFRSVSLVTGPEGGLEIAEVEQAVRAGLSVCTLGSRILRCETAPLCALSAVMYAAGEF